MKNLIFWELNTFQNDILNGSEIRVYAFLKFIV